MMTEELMILKSTPVSVSSIELSSKSRARCTVELCTVLIGPRATPVY